MMKTRKHAFLLFWPLLCTASIYGQSAADPGTDSTVTKPDSTTFNLLYQTQSKKRTVAATGELRGDVLQKTVSSTFGGYISGRLPGLFTFQPSGEPGNDDVQVYLRGRSPMILVDGTPQSFPSINPEQIESITLLKDAVSTAMLGMRAANGAILITTKKGSAAAQKIEFTAQYGTQRPTRMPQFLDAANYATLYNEALVNDGLAPVYTQNDIDLYNNGSDPVGHPNVNWQKQILKDQCPYSRYDLAVSGSGRSARYFVNLDYMNQQGLLKTEPFNVYNTNSDYKRIIFRSNIEADLGKYLTAALNLFGRVQHTNQPGVTTGTIFNNLRNTPNNAYPVRNSDSSLGGTLDYQNNLYGQSVLSGYQPIYERDFKADLSLKGNLDAVTKGLYIKVLAAINAYQRETSNRSKTFAVYKQSETAGIKSYTKYGNTGDQANSTTANSQNRLFYTELLLGYEKDLSKNDHIAALLMVNNDYRMVNSELPLNFTGVAGKVSYDYKSKYLAEFAIGYNGTERYPENNRYGAFPALGLGWNITNEGFMKSRPAFLNYLKLRASFGKSGNANYGYYDYYQYYITGSGYNFGSTVPTSTTTLQQGQLANPYITWEKANKFSAGIDAELFKQKLIVNIDYFNDKYYDLVQQRNNGSDLLGTDYMRENIGSNRFSGLEVLAGWQEQYRSGLSWNLSANFTLIKSKVLYQAEPRRMYEWQVRTGRPVGQLFGYVADGLFSSQADINSHAFQGGNIKPGDIKYKDLNNDGMINGDDQQAIGNTGRNCCTGLMPVLHTKVSAYLYYSRAWATTAYSLPATNSGHLATMAGHRQRRHTWTAGRRKTLLPAIRGYGWATMPTIWPLLLTG